MVSLQTGRQVNRERTTFLVTTPISTYDVITSVTRVNLSVFSRTNGKDLVFFSTIDKITLVSNEDQRSRPLSRDPLEAQGQRARWERSRWRGGNQTTATPKRSNRKMHDYKSEKIVLRRERLRLRERERERLRERVSNRE